MNGSYEKKRGKISLDPFTATSKYALHPEDVTTASTIRLNNIPNESRKIFLARSSLIFVAFECRKMIKSIHRLFGILISRFIIGSRESIASKICRAIV